MINDSQSWCILQTGHSSTIALADALADAGFTVWTPIRKTTRDVLRAEEGREPLPGGRGATLITVPIVPAFVFAAYDHLVDLLRMVDSPSLTYRVWDRDERRMVVRGRPHFTVFHFEGSVPRVPDQELEPLRDYERRRARRPIKPKRQRGKRGRDAQQFAMGDAVRVPDGPFAGLEGVIVPSLKNASVRVEFCGGALHVEIEPWLVQAIDVDTRQPKPGTAAKAA